MSLLFKNNNKCTDFNVFMFHYFLVLLIFISEWMNVYFSDSYFNYLTSNICTR